MSTAVTDATVLAPAAQRKGFLRRLLSSPVFWFSAGWILLVVLASTFADVIGPKDPLAQDIPRALEGPSGTYLLGTDSLGRDVLSRLIAGASVSLTGSALAVAVAAAIGIPLGLIAGFRGGAVDSIINRITDFLFALPGIVLILAMVALFGTGTFVSMTTLGVIYSPAFIRLVRASTLAVRRELFIDAAKVSGLSTTRIVFRHVFPNVLAPLVIQLTLALGGALETQAGLSFLGLGPAAPAPSWGAMVTDGSRYIIAQPWLMVPPGVAIIVTILAFNFLGDAVRDASSGSGTAALPQRYSLLSLLIGRRPRRTPLVQKSTTTPLETAPADNAAAAVAPAAPVDGPPVLSVRDLAISVQRTGIELVHPTSFEVSAGQTIGLVGESGSGKTLTALAVLGLLSPGVTVTGGSIEFAGVDLLGLSPEELMTYRGKRIGYISQEPMVALDPSFDIRSQLLEPLRNHHGLRGAAARARALELLELVGIQRPAEVLASYPHQLSGGMAQRVAIAIALTGEPELLIADEPTTALDVTVQAEILDLLRSLQSRLGMAMLLVTHDFGVVADICDDIVVLKQGEVVEHAPARTLFAEPQHAYTKMLLAASPENWSFPPKPQSHTAEPLLEIDDLVVRFPARGIGKQPFTALKGISLAVHAGETVGLVGESGSGKTTLGRAVLGLTKVHSGDIRWRGTSIAHASASRRRELSQDIQVVFQDPYSSLNPKMTITDILSEPLFAHKKVGRREAQRRVRELLDQVQLPADAAERMPREFSGGQRQRIAIARALVMDPQLIVCDEALSALDLSTQEKVVDLLRDIQIESGVAYLFIAHDLAVVRGVSDRVSVLYHGEMVEQGDAEVIGSRPQEPYTRRLLLSAPVPDPVRQAERREERQREAARVRS